MKVSEIQKEDVIAFLKLDEEECEETFLGAVMEAALGFIQSYTGLSQGEIDQHEEFYIAYMVLCQDMYDNRSMYVDKNNTNKVVESILGMHCVNLLG